MMLNPALRAKIDPPHRPVPPGPAKENGRKCSRLHPLADVPEKAVPVSGQAAAGGVEEGTRHGTLG